MTGKKNWAAFGKELATESPLHIRVAGSAGESGVQDPFSQETAVVIQGGPHTTYK